MKRANFYKKGFRAIVALVVLMMPTLALSSSLSLIYSASGEDAKFDPPLPPFGFDANGLPSIDGVIGYILSTLGIDIMGKYYGPGISSWDNYVAFSDNGQNMYASASAVGTVAVFFDPREPDPAEVLKLFDTQYVKDDWYWAATYELNGNPAEEPANVSYGYSYNYIYFNLAVAGRSKSSTSADLFYYIIPASLTGKYSPDPMKNWPFNIFAPNPFKDATYSGPLLLGYAKEFDKFVGGFTEDSGRQTGSKDLGTMGVGDRLYVIGHLGAYAECENYFTGLTVATMFPSFTGTVQSTIPVTPVPTTLEKFTYPAVVSPVLSSAPMQAQPVGVGSVVWGGGILSIEVALNQFAGPVDVYFLVWSPAVDPENIYQFTSIGTFQTVSAGLSPWMPNVTGPISQTLFGDVPTVMLPRGQYFLGVFVTPAGDQSLTKGYLWVTSFTAPPIVFSEN